MGVDDDLGDLHHSNGVGAGHFGHLNGAADGSQPYPSRPTAKPTFEGHPLFELDDGQPEHRDIVRLTFQRKNADGKLLRHPEIIPAKDVKSWADVARWWGGGHYRVIARDAGGHFQGQFPSGDELFFIEGPEKPFVLRDGLPIAAGPAPGAAVPAPAAPPPPVSAPPPAPAVDAVQVVKELLGPIQEELRVLREKASVPPPAPPPPPGPAPLESMLVAMFKAQGEEARARADQAAADAKARAESEAARAKADAERAAAQARADADVRIAEIKAATDNQNRMWEALKGGDKGGGEDSKLVALLLKMMPAPMNPIELMKAAREAAGPAGGAAESDPIKSITDLVGNLVTADAMKTQNQPQAQPAAAPPAPREEHRPRGPMAYVPGVGVVEVHAPEHMVRANAPPAAMSPAAAPVAPAPASAPAPPAAPLPAVAPAALAAVAPSPVAPTAVAEATLAQPPAPAPPAAVDAVAQSAVAPPAASSAAPPLAPAASAPADPAPARPPSPPAVTGLAPAAVAPTEAAPAATSAPIATPVDSPVSDAPPIPAPPVGSKRAPSLAEMRAELSTVLRRMKAQPEYERVRFLQGIPPFAAQAAALAPVFERLSDEDIDNIAAQVPIAELQGVLALHPNGVSRHGS